MSHQLTKATAAFLIWVCYINLVLLEKDPSDLKHEAELKKSQFIQLTELADQMAGAGHYDIYTDTFEKIQFKLNSVSRV